MATDEAALIVVQPDDTIKAIIQKVRAAGSHTVELLVPDGLPTLQDVGNWQRLQKAVSVRNIELLLFSSDDETLAAARQSGVETVGVRDTRITLPGMPVADTTIPSAPPAPQPAAEADEEVWQALDALAAGPPIDRQPASAPAPVAETAVDEDDPYAAFDDLSDVFNADAEQHATPPAREGGAPPADEDDPFAALDDLSDAFADEAAAGGGRVTEQPASAPAPAAPRQRIRPEDIELTDDEKRRAAAPMGATAQRRRSEARPRPEHREEPAPRQQAERKRGVPSLVLILAAVLLLFLLVAAFVLLRDRLPFGAHTVTITVQLPTPPTETVPIVDQPIARVPVDAENTEQAVQAEEIVATVVYTETGEVLEETLTPSGVARGVVTMINLNTQPLGFPQGTEFLGTNAEGNQVVFTSDAPVDVPGASTSRQGAQIITSLGQASVEITANTPGSGANIDANTITEIRVPGQGAISVNAGGLELSHGPIAGGSEEPIRVVKDTNVQSVMDDALTGLNRRARQVLEQQAAVNQGLELQTGTIYPQPEAFSSGEGYRQTVNPPVGERVDPANPFFTVTVEGEFSALATPPNSSLEEQLREVLPNQLASEERLPVSMSSSITNFHWDGSVLTVDGVLEPTGTPIELNREQRVAIIEAVQGRTRAEAEAALDSFVNRGIIGGYSLPDDLETLPEQIQLNPVAAGEGQPET